jgi:hypothetical protein
MGVVAAEAVRRAESVLRDARNFLKRGAGIEKTIHGAAVGDSVAWWVQKAECMDLTRESSQKPWLGSGVSRILPFVHSVKNGTLLLATDGLVKYVDRATLCAIARQSPLDTSARRLIDAVRPASGRLPDDVAIR